MDNILSIASSPLVDAPPRGGATIIQVESKIITFGGADRTGHLFKDCYYKSTSSEAWTAIETTGDIPTPRSGHAVAKYGRYMFLFGGIDFAEEIDYNDLYILDTDIWDWKYVGEAGVEVTGRNSHTLAVLQCSHDDTSASYLIIYGGASGALGPQGDTIYALLPPLESIDTTSIFVEWKTSSTMMMSPGAREMHCSCVDDHDILYIIGGRNEDGQLLQDVWTLQCDPSSSSLSMIWKNHDEMILPEGTCSHSAGILHIKSHGKRICLFGGISSSGTISDKMLCFDISSSWVEMRCDMSIAGRFGAAMCSVGVDHAYNSLVLFGGVDVDHDYNDVVIITSK